VSWQLATIVSGSTSRVAVAAVVVDCCCCRDISALTFISRIVGIT